MFIELRPPFAIATLISRPLISIVQLISRRYSANHATKNGASLVIRAVKDSGLSFHYVLTTATESESPTSSNRLGDLDVGLEHSCSRR